MSSIEKASRYLGLLLLVLSLACLTTVTFVEEAGSSPAETSIGRPPTPLAFSSSNSITGPSYRSAVPIAGVPTIGNDGDTAIQSRSQKSDYVVNPIRIGLESGIQIIEVTRGQRPRILSKVAAPNLSDYPQFRVGPDGTAGAAWVVEAKSGSKVQDQVWATYREPGKNWAPPIDLGAAPSDDVGVAVGAGGHVAVGAGGVSGGVLSTHVPGGSWKAIPVESRNGVSFQAPPIYMGDGRTLMLSSADGKWVRFISEEGDILGTAHLPRVRDPGPATYAGTGRWQFALKGKSHLRAYVLEKPTNRSSLQRTLRTITVGANGTVGKELRRPFRTLRHVGLTGGTRALMDGDGNFFTADLFDHFSTKQSAADRVAIFRGNKNRKVTRLEVRIPPYPLVTRYTNGKRLSRRDARLLSNGGSVWSLVGASARTNGGVNYCFEASRLSFSVPTSIATVVVPPVGKPRVKVAVRDPRYSSKLMACGENAAIVVRRPLKRGRILGYNGGSQIFTAFYK